MNSGTQFGFEEWLPRRAALLTALGVWTAGFALAGAIAWRMHQPTGDTVEMTEDAILTTDTAPAEAAESDGVVLMPGDTVVGHRTPAAGVTIMQKP